MNLYKKLIKEKHIKYQGKWIKDIFIGNKIVNEFKTFKGIVLSRDIETYYKIIFVNNSTINLLELKEEDFEICPEGEVVPSDLKEYIHYKIGNYILPCTK